MARFITHLAGITSSAFSNQTKLVKDSSNILHSVIVTSDGDLTYNIKKYGTCWTEATEMYAGVSATSCSIDIATNDTINVAFTSMFGGNLSALYGTTLANLWPNQATLNGSLLGYCAGATNNWSASKLIYLDTCDTNSAPDICLTADDKYHIVYKKNGKINCYHNISGITSIKTLSINEGVTLSANYPDIENYGTILHCVWTEDDGGIYYNKGVYSESSNQYFWTGASALTDTKLYRNAPSLGVGYNGKLQLAVPALSMVNAGVDTYDEWKTYTSINNVDVETNQGYAGLCQSQTSGYIVNKIALNFVPADPVEFDEESGYFYAGLDNISNGFGPVTYNLTTGTTVTSITNRLELCNTILTRDAESIRFRVSSTASQGLSVSNLSIVERNGTSIDGLGNLTYITFNGLTNVILGANESKWSDWINYNIDNTKNYFVTYFASGGLRGTTSTGLMGNRYFPNEPTSGYNYSTYSIWGSPPTNQGTLTSTWGDTPKTEVFWNYAVTNDNTEYPNWHHGSVNDVPAGANCTLYLKMDEKTGNAIDSSTYGNNAIEQGTVPSVSGFISGARCPYSAVNYFRVADSSNIRISNNSSFACWLKRTGTIAVLTTEMAFGKMKNIPGPYEYGLGITAANKVEIQMGQRQPLSTTIMTQDVWYFAVCTRNVSANELKLYINGTLESTYTVFDGGAISGDDLTIGRGEYNGTYVPLVNGVVDEIMFFNKTLSQTEITALYNSAAKYRWGAKSLTDVGLLPTGYRYLKLQAGLSGTNYTPTINNITADYVDRTRVYDTKAEFDLGAYSNTNGTAYYGTVQITNALWNPEIYEGYNLPNASTPVWARVISGGSTESVSGGKLTVYSPGGGYLYYSITANNHPVAECRVKMISGTFNIFCTQSGSSMYMAIYITPTAATVYRHISNDPGGDGQIIYTMDTTNDFHTYRIVWGPSSVVSLYVDDVYVGATGPSYYGASGGPAFIQFGAYLTNAVHAIVDWVKSGGVTYGTKIFGAYETPWIDLGQLHSTNFANDNKWEILDQMETKVPSYLTYKIKYNTADVEPSDSSYITLSSGDKIEPYRYNWIRIDFANSTPELVDKYSLNYIKGNNKIAWNRKESEIAASGEWGGCFTTLYSISDLENVSVVAGTSECYVGYAANGKLGIISNYDGNTMLTRLTVNGIDHNISICPDLVDGKAKYLYTQGHNSISKDFTEFQDAEIVIDKPETSVATLKGSGA